MASKESQVAAHVRLCQWALEIQECQNRPKDMNVEEWCSPCFNSRGFTSGGFNGCGSFWEIQMLAPDFQEAAVFYMWIWAVVFGSYLRM